jgi:hypothetical protein
VKKTQARLKQGQQVLFKGEIITKIQKIGWGHYEIFSRTTRPNELRFTLKYPDIVQIQDSNRRPQGLDGATIKKTVFICAYIEKKTIKIFSRTSRPISIRPNANNS